MPEIVPIPGSSVAIFQLKVSLIGMSHLFSYCLQLQENLFTWNLGQRKKRTLTQSGEYDSCGPVKEKKYGLNQMNMIAVGQRKKKIWTQSVNMIAVALLNHLVSGILF